MQFAYGFLFAKDKANKISLSLLFYGKKICEMYFKENFPIYEINESCVLN